MLLSINGFGSDSSFRERKAYAPIVHAATGLLRDRGQLGQTPTQPRNAYSDVLTALHGTVALLAALRVAEATGVGQRVEVPMFDATLASHSESGNVLLDPPDERVMNPIYDAGPHGYIAVAGAAPHVWLSLAAAFPGRARAIPRRRARSSRPRRARATTRSRPGWRASRRRPSVLEKLARAKLACAPVVTLREALESPLAARARAAHARRRPPRRNASGGALARALLGVAKRDPRPGAAAAASTAPRSCASCSASTTRRSPALDAERRARDRKHRSDKGD